MKVPGVNNQNLQIVNKELEFVKTSSKWGRIWSNITSGQLGKGHNTEKALEIIKSKIKEMETNVDEFDLINSEEFKISIGQIKGIRTELKSDTLETIYGIILGLESNIPITTEEGSLSLISPKTGAPHEQYFHSVPLTPDEIDKEQKDKRQTTKESPMIANVIIYGEKESGKKSLLFRNNENRYLDTDKDTYISNTIVFKQKEQTFIDSSGKEAYERMNFRVNGSEPPDLFRKPDTRPQIHLVVVDLSKCLDRKAIKQAVKEETNRLKPLGENQRVVIVGTKCDEVPEDKRKEQAEDLKEIAEDKNYSCCAISAKEGYGFDELNELLLTEHRRLRLQD